MVISLEGAVAERHPSLILGFVPSLLITLQAFLLGKMDAEGWRDASPLRQHCVHFLLPRDRSFDHRRRAEWLDLAVA
jgi:hypothetical protein